MDYTAGTPAAFLTSILPETGVGLLGMLWFLGHGWITGLNKSGGKSICTLKKLGRITSFANKWDIHPFQDMSAAMWQHRLQYFVCEKAGLLLSGLLFDLIVDYPDRLEVLVGCCETIRVLDTLIWWSYFFPEHLLRKNTWICCLQSLFLSQQPPILEEPVHMPGKHKSSRPSGERIPCCRPTTSAPSR